MVCMYACMYVCMYVSMYVCMHVCSQDRHANTMSLGEWQWPVLAACVMSPSSARRPSWERTVCCGVGECRRLANELRRGTWQVKQVRTQQHAWTTKLCSESWVVGELPKQEVPAVVKINGSFSRRIETCSIDVLLENIFHACAHLSSNKKHTIISVHACIEEAAGSECCLRVCNHVLFPIRSLLHTACQSFQNETPYLIVMSC